MLVDSRPLATGDSVYSADFMPGALRLTDEDFATVERNPYHCGFQPTSNSRGDPMLRSLRLEIFFYCTAIMILLAGLARAGDAAEKRLPNLIIVLTDDQGYADVGFNGCRDIPTPNIDRIASEGVRFTNGYVTFAVCGPSRAGLITGRYQDRFGSCLNPTIDPSNANAGVPLSEKNLAEVLGPAGYTSMAVGKWHLGTHPTLRPLERGFDEFFGFLSGGHRYFPDELTLNDFSEINKQFEWYRTRLLRNEERIDIKEYLTDELSNAACDFIERQHDKPFLLYLAYNAPHTPLQATEKYLDRFRHIQDKKRRTYAAMVSAVDDGVGRVLAKLDEHDLSKDTIVVFLSDNGGPTRSNGSNNDPLRGGKGSPYEGGIRVPFAMRWTGTIPAGMDYELPVISLDIFATIVAQAGITVSSDRPLDGVDLVPYLSGAKQGAPHDRLFWRFYKKNILVVREGADKLIRTVSDDRTELYELNADIGESTDVANQKAGVTRELIRQADDWAKDLKPPAYPGLGTWLKK
jgi:arylsulfatase A-like enzyme